MRVQCIQVVYLTFEWLWNLAREIFAPVWSLSKIFISTKLVIKITEKDSIRKFPKSATPWVFDLAWRFLRFLNVQSLCGWPKSTTFLLKLDEFWVNLSDQCRNHDFNVVNQSISVNGSAIIRRPNIRQFYPVHGSSQPLVFREPFRQINCSQ